MPTPPRLRSTRPPGPPIPSPPTARACLDAALFQIQAGAAPTPLTPGVAEAVRAVLEPDFIRELPLWPAAEKTVLDLAFQIGQAAATAATKPTLDFDDIKAAFKAVPHGCAREAAPSVDVPPPPGETQGRYCMRMLTL